MHRILRCLGFLLVAAWSVPSAYADAILEASALNPTPDMMKKAVGVSGLACAWTSVGGEANNKVKQPDTACGFKLAVAPRPAKLIGVELDGVGHKDVAKDKPATFTAISESERTADGKTDKARAVANLDAIDSDADGKSDKAELRASVTIDQKGDFFTQGAARVTDPFVVPAGSYDYAPELSQLTLMALGDDVGVAALAFAGHSSVLTVEPLWQLWLTLDTTGAFAMDFQSAELLNQDDEEVEERLLRRLDTSVAGVVRLTGGHTLFHGILSSDRSFTIEQDTMAAAVAPEPNVASLFGCALGLLLLIRGREILFRRGLRP